MGHSLLSDEDPGAGEIYGKIVVTLGMLPTLSLCLRVKNVDEVK